MMEPDTKRRLIDKLLAQATALADARLQHQKHLSDAQAQLKVQHEALIALTGMVAELHKSHWEVPTSQQWDRPCATKANWERFEQREPQPGDKGYPYGYHTSPNCKVIRSLDPVWPEDGRAWFTSRTMAWKPYGQCKKNWQCQSNAAASSSISVQRGGQAG